MTTYPVVGALRPHLVGYMLGTHFDEFNTPTIQGLVRINGRRIDFLAVSSKHPGRGDFDRFLQECKNAYDTIGVWEIMNPQLIETLSRRGFRKVIEWVDGSAEVGMRWDRRGDVNPSR